MNLDKIIVGAFSLMWAIFIYWFFLMKKETAVLASNRLKIIVDGGYNPQNIVVKKDQPIELIFFRLDPSSCLDEIIIPEFGIKKFLLLNTETAVEIVPDKIGEFEFQCGMNMFHGKIKVV